jgi:hypothetical protein
MASIAVRLFAFRIVFCQELAIAPLEKHGTMRDQELVCQTMTGIVSAHHARDRSPDFLPKLHAAGGVDAAAKHSGAKS